MTEARRVLGEAGEEAAAGYLAKAGWRILARRWKDSGSSELTISAETERKIRNEFARDHDIRATANLAAGVRAA